MKHILFLFLSLSSGLAFAAGSSTSLQDVDDGPGYDAIVGELEKMNAPLPTESYSGDPFELAKIHLGFGMISSYTNFRLASGKEDNGLLNGFEFSFGIDLFSPNWMALGSLRNFSSEKVGDSLSAKLQEFDLKIFYKNFLTKRIQGMFGLGLSARYLELAIRENGIEKKTQYTTPASIFSAGFLAHLGKQIFIGPEFSYRSAVITESADKSAFDGMLKLDAQF